MNTKALSIMDLKCIAVIVFFLGMVGCVKEDVEPPSEFDIKGEVFALVSPDTVQVGQPFKVQISFPTVCGGTFSHIIQNNSIGTVTLTSVIHVIAQTECPGSGFIETETTSVDRKSTRLNSSHIQKSRMPSSA